MDSSYSPLSADISSNLRFNGNEGVSSGSRGVRRTINVLVPKSLRVVLTSPWFTVERHQIDICNETA